MTQTIRSPFVLVVNGTGLSNHEHARWVDALRVELAQQPEAVGPVRVINMAALGRTSTAALAAASEISNLRPTHILTEGFAIEDSLQTAGDYTNQVPDMASDVQSGFTSQFNGTNGGYLAFRPYSTYGNGHTSSAHYLSSAGTIGIICPSSRVIRAYSFYPNTEGGNSTRSFKDWTFQGSNDGVTWVTLHTVTNNPARRNGIKISFPLANTTAYTRYRLNVTAFNGAYGGIAEFTLMLGTADAYAPGVSQATHLSNLSALRAAWVAANPDVKITWQTMNPLAVGSLEASRRSSLAAFYADEVTYVAGTSDVMLNHYNGPPAPGLVGGWPTTLANGLILGGRGEELYPNFNAGVRRHMLPTVLFHMRQRMATFWGLSAPTVPARLTVKQLTLNFSSAVEGNGGRIFGEIVGMVPGLALEHGAIGWNTGPQNAFYFAYSDDLGDDYKTVRGNASLNYEANTTSTFTVTETVPGIPGSPQTTVFTVSVGNVGPSISAVRYSDVTAYEEAPTIPVAGGAIIWITGAEFQSGSCTVAIGGVACTGVTVINDSKIRCITPALSAGVHNIVVTTVEGATTGRPITSMASSAVVADWFSASRGYDSTNSDGYSAGGQSGRFREGAGLSISVGNHVGYLGGSNGAASYLDNTGVINSNGAGWVGDRTGAASNSATPAQDGFTISSNFSWIIGGYAAGGGGSGEINYDDSAQGTNIAQRNGGLGSNGPAGGGHGLWWRYVYVDEFTSYWQSYDYGGQYGRPGALWFKVPTNVGFIGCTSTNANVYLHLVKDGFHYIEIRTDNSQLKVF